MELNKFILKFCLLGVTGLASLSSQAQETRAERPNVVIILADDVGYGDVGCNGCRDIPTPHIDRIARTGVKFTNGYVTYAVCGPSRAGLLTGRYQERFGFGRNLLLAPTDPEMGLPLSERTLADLLKPAGYRRSEERRVGEEGVRQCRTRVAADR